MILIPETFKNDLEKLFVKKAKFPENVLMEKLISSPERLLLMRHRLEFDRPYESRGVNYEVIVLKDSDFLEIMQIAELIYTLKKENKELLSDNINLKDFKSKIMSAKNALINLED